MGRVENKLREQYLVRTFVDLADVSLLKLSCELSSYQKPTHIRRRVTVRRDYLNLLFRMPRTNSFDWDRRS